MSRPGSLTRAAQHRRHTTGTDRQHPSRTITSVSAQTTTLAPPSSPTRTRTARARSTGAPARRPVPSTTPVTVRGARAGDLPGLARMLVRATPSTRLGWYGRGGSVLPLVQQDAWLRRPGSVVVERAPGEVVAVAGLRPACCDSHDPAPDPIAVSVEVVVADAWQRRGIGTSLLRHLSGVALAAGRTEIQVAPGADLEARAVMLGALAERAGSRVRGQHHLHGACPRVHLSRGTAALLEATDGLPTGLRPRPETGLRQTWSMAVLLVAATPSRALR